MVKLLTVVLILSAASTLSGGGFPGNNSDTTKILLAHGSYGIKVLDHAIYDGELNVTLTPKTQKGPADSSKTQTLVNNNTSAIDHDKAMTMAFDELPVQEHNFDDDIIYLSKAKTTVRPLSGESIIRADFEDGKLAPLMKAAGQPQCSWKITTERAHTGSRSLALTCKKVPQNKSVGQRIKYEGQEWAGPSEPKNLPDEAYYSAWYFIPQKISGRNNIFQWKGKVIEKGRQTARPLATVTLENMEPNLWSKSGTGRYGSAVRMDRAGVNVPIAEWFQLACYYRFSKQKDGQIVCWLDGEVILRADNHITEFSEDWERFPRQWTVNNYALKGGQSPSTHTIFIDDAEVKYSK